MDTRATAGVNFDDERGRLSVEAVLSDGDTGVVFATASAVEFDSTRLTVKFASKL